MAVAKLKDDPRAESFIVDAAKNDKDMAVRRAAVEALRLKGTADVKVLENLLRPPQIKSPAPATHFNEVP